MQIGTIVHFVLNHGPAIREHRPAIVVEVINEYTVALQIFSSGTKGTEPKGDCLPNVFWKPQCVQDETGKSPNTWHHPESGL